MIRSQEPENMFKIVWKSFLLNIKNFLAFFASIIVTITVWFLMMYVQEALGNIKHTGIFVNQLSGDLEELMKMLNSVLMIVGVLVIAYSVQFYIYSRMKDYGMLKILGIRRKDMNRILILEYGIGCICSCAIGIGTGQVVSFGIGKILEHILGASFMLKIEMAKVYKYTAGIAVLMVFLSVIVISIVLSEKELSLIVRGTTVKEKRLISKKSLVFSGLGFAVMVLCSVFLFKSENLYLQNYLLLFFCLGFGILFLFGSGYFFEKYRNSPMYFRKILVWNELYHYFNSNKYMILIQTITGIIVIYFSSFFISGISENQEKTYPNDILCICEDSSILKNEIKERWGTEGVSFPFAEVDPDFCEGRIGISGSEYERNFGEEVKLKENEIISICDTENMQSLIEDEKTKKSRKLFFENRKEGEAYLVKSEKIKSGLGFGFGGIVVFSDSAFEKIRQDNERQKEILLLHIEESKINEITGWLKQQPENRIDVVFSRQTEMENARKENTLSFVILFTADFAVLFFGMFVQWLKAFTDLGRMRNKYLFLNTIGMQRKACKKTLKKEIGVPVWTEIICAVLIGGMFGGRNLNGEWEMLFLILAAYFLLQYTFLNIMRTWAQKKIQGGN